MDDQDPARPVRVHRRSPPTSRSRFSEFEFRKRTPVKLIRFRFICEKPSLGERQQKTKKKRRLISRGGFVRNLRTMLCTPLLAERGFGSFRVNWVEKTEGVILRVNLPWNGDPHSSGRSVRSIVNPVVLCQVGLKTSALLSIIRQLFLKLNLNLLYLRIPQQGRTLIEGSPSRGCKKIVA